MFAYKYKINQRLSTDKYIFKGTDLISMTDIVIKMEPIEEELKLLHHEAKVYYYLKDVESVLPIKWYGTFNGYKYIVLPYIPMTLSELIHQRDVHIDFPAIFNKAVLAMKNIHNHNIVHRDIKPDNILINNNDLFIIDFGFAKLESKVEKKTANIIGTPEYLSLNGHNQIELSKRDDMESLMYVFMHLKYGMLPWEGKSLQEIKQMKMKLLDTNCFLLPYLKSYQKLKFSETPKYFSFSTFTV